MSEVKLQPSVKENGKFKNPWPTWRKPSFSGLLQFLFRSTDYSNVPCKEELDKELPILKLDNDLLQSPPSSGVRFTWLGHASCLVQMDNVTFLTDPVFSQRCSPVPSIAGPKRYRDPPCRVAELPQIDAVVISHNHYDHLDCPTVIELHKRFGDSLKWFVPLGLESWMRGCGCTNVSEQDWWQEEDSTHKGVKFVLTPAQHWCKRGVFDDNKVLWGSWTVIGPTKRFHFAGDTGYCESFKQIGQKYGPFDVAAIPIGAYEPSWFLQPQHVNPEEAVQIHQDIQAKQSIGVHWGTFKMGKEFYLEPRHKLGEVSSEKGLSPSEFITIHHGETKLFGEDS